MKFPVLPVITLDGGATLQTTNFLKSACSTCSINGAKDQSLDANYKYWRTRIFYSMFVGYAFFYFTRKSYNFVMPVMLDDLGYTKAQLGILGTALYLSYGISKFASGVMSEYSNPRYFMAAGIIITGLLNIWFGLSSSILAFTIICILNGWFQGFGWPACTKLLTYWYSRTERGGWWSIASTSHGVGGMLIPLFAGFIATTLGWRWGMFMPGILGIVIGLFLINRLRDIPTTLGLPPIEEYKNDYPPDVAVSDSGKDNLTVKEVLFGQVLNNRWVWLLSFSYFFVYVVRTGINDWAHIFLKEAKGYDVLLANASIFWFELGGIAGMLVAGFGSDTLFKGRRVPVIIGYTFGLMLALPAFWYSPQGYYVLDYLLMGIIGFLVFGPQMLVGLVVAECVDKKAACTANGFAGLFGCLGSAAAAYPIGYIVDHWGWSGYFMGMLACTLAILVITLKASPSPSRLTLSYS
jgi:OPA family sugar phosphate sensor protein UhpC-like MFS transporter